MSRGSGFRVQGSRFKVQGYKRIIIFGLFFLIPFLIISKTKSVSSAAPKYTIKIGSLVTPNSVWGKAVTKVVRYIERETGGEVNIEHHCCGVLGGEKSLLEMVMFGGIQAAGVPSFTLASIVPEVHILELPFLFDDRDEAYYLIDTVIAPHLKEKLEKKGLLTSAFMESGFMEFVTPRFIEKPDDLKELKFGSWESPVHISILKAFGGKPIPIPVTEVPTAYSRGRVDSGANSLNGLLSWDYLFGSALKRNKIYITETRFSYQAGVLVANAKYMRGMPANLREIFLRGLDKLTVELRESLRKAEPESRRELKRRGYHIREMSGEDRAVFVAEAQKVYKEYEKQVGKEFLSKVLAGREKYRKKLKNLNKI
ncbi:MAG: TRAP transporter substrate-binding protein DctP [bacterium]